MGHVLPLHPQALPSACIHPLSGHAHVSTVNPHPNPPPPQFFLREEDIAKGLTRANATAPRLAELNNYVPISVLEGELSEDKLARYSVIVLTNVSLEEQKRINAYTHAHSRALIIADTRGLFG
jgi:ubiquitin-activating enzyme E1